MGGIDRSRAHRPAAIAQTELSGLPRIDQERADHRRLPNTVPLLGCNQCGRLERAKELRGFADQKDRSRLRIRIHAVFSRSPRPAPKAMRMSRGWVHPSRSPATAIRERTQSDHSIRQMCPVSIPVSRPQPELCSVPSLRTGPQGSPGVLGPPRSRIHAALPSFIGRFTTR